MGATTHGHTVGASLEGGLPIALSTVLSIEPQAQLIWQHTSIGDLDDGISSVSFHAASGLTGRPGVKVPRAGIPLHSTAQRFLAALSAPWRWTA
ncbi:autotransporter outer membrane beta-barrel domain-containing protein [Paraburkholderia sp.]|uniref:autotransporter domain-containing protein n=1 Tax=Paraburkholderia sp. TaxID=1926495 RepID=UPI00257D11D2|nr:autotransporter outer membrane beta-barrel domain-containing protein [Paraburkholderia sp.]